MSIKGYIKYRSVEPIGSKPDYFSTGGYAVRMPGGGVLRNFDWEGYEGDGTIDEGGHFVIECTMETLDEEFTELGPIYIDEELAGDAIEAAELSSGKLDEVSYICGFSEDGVGKEINMHVLEFYLYKDIADGQTIWRFPNKDLDEINRHNDELFQKV